MIGRDGMVRVFDYTTGALVVVLLKEAPLRKFSPTYATAAASR